MSRIDEIHREIAALDKELADIQSSCSHPDPCVEYKYGSNTGNWDKGDDCYWIDFKCSLCDLNWTVHSGTKNWEKYSSFSYLKKKKDVTYQKKK